MERPWVRPQEVKDYSDSDKVKARSDEKLAFDIARAEKYVIFNTHNKFDSEEYKEKLPSDVKMAVILLSEAYALKSIGMKDGTKSAETFDDYSYTIDLSVDELANLGLGPLLDDYVISPESGKVTMKLRSL
ncbi:MAG: DUF3199 family protein [Hespellia sp.]|nr:DUF3199 family protein [Hespellia sp.]